MHLMSYCNNLFSSILSFIIDYDCSFEENKQIFNQYQQLEILIISEKEKKYQIPIHCLSCHLKVLSVYSKGYICSICFQK